MEIKGTDCVDVKIADAKFFPHPNKIFMESSLVENEYWKGWKFNGLSVIASVGKYNGVEWLHVSFSRRRRMPTYDDLQHAGMFNVDRSGSCLGSGTRHSFR